MIVVTRVSTNSINQNSLGDMMRLQSELGTLQQQISSGKIASNFKQLSAIGQTERVLGLETQQKKIADYVRNNTVVTNRVQAYNSSVTNLIDVAEEFRNLMVTRRNPATANALPFKQLTDSYLASIKANLNIELEGRYLFAGSKTNTKPVETIEEPNFITDPATGNRSFTNKYYQGDELKLKAQASDALVLEYGVTANDPAFQKLISAIHLAETGDAANDDTILVQAADLASEAITELASLQAGLNNNITILDQANKEHEDFSIFLKQTLTDATETDIGEATIRLNSIQTTLQASYLAYAKISSLRLTDYLS